MEKSQGSIHRFDWMRLRGLSGARDEFHFDAIVQNLFLRAGDAGREALSPNPSKEEVAKLPRRSTLKTRPARSASAVEDQHQGSRPMRRRFSTGRSRRTDRDSSRTDTRVVRPLRAAHSRAALPPRAVHTCKARRCEGSRRRGRGRQSRGLVAAQRQEVSQAAATSLRWQRANF
jgi:hypothetical protein